MAQLKITAHKKVALGPMNEEMGWAYNFSASVTKTPEETEKKIANPYEDSSIPEKYLVNLSRLGINGHCNFPVTNLQGHDPDSPGWGPSSGHTTDEEHTYLERVKTACQAACTSIEAEWVAQQPKQLPPGV